MRVYYQSPTAVITDQTISTSGLSDQDVRIDDISQVYLVHTEARVSRGFLIRKLWPVSVATALVVPLAAESAGPLLMSGVLLLVVGAVVIATPIRVQRVDELWAIIGDGRHLCLFRNPDHLTVGQVQRALLRARENCRP